MTLKTSRYCAGLIAGLGPAATVHYYNQLLAAFAKRGITPRLVMSHAEANFVREAVGAGDTQGLAEYLAEHVKTLARAGADFAAVPAVAPHICAPILEKLAPIPLVDIVTATGEELRAKGFRRIGMMGSRWVMETRFFGRLADIDLVPLQPDEVDIVHDIYMAIVASGAIAAADTQRLRAIARNAIARDSLQAIALAGTDLAVAFTEETAGFPAIDCARVHIDALIGRMLGQELLDK